VILIRQWIDVIGNHMWRFYFSRPDADPGTMTDPNRLQWEACSRAVTLFSREEYEILHMYFTSPWGKDLHVVEDYAEQTGQTTIKIWSTIKAANRAAAEERGLVDRKGV